MKRFLIIWFMSLLLIGCKDQGVDMLFDKLPEERMGERLQELQSKLLESPNGWKATLNTGTATAKSAYNFYIDFENNNKCKMVGDLTAATSATWHESTYRLIWAMNASLVFDTFTYITMLQEPSSTYGGVAPHGYRSDIEFEYVRSTADSVFLKGKKYQHDLVLTKISASEVSQLDQGNYTTKIAEVVDFFVQNTNAYFTFNNSDVKYSVQLNRATKEMTINWIEANAVKSVKTNFVYTLQGIDLFQPLQLNGVKLNGIKADNAKLTMMSNSTSYEILNNNVPIVPLSLMFSNTGVYNTIGINGATPPAGIVSGFNSAWASQVSLLTANSRVPTFLTFTLVNSTQARLRLRYSNPTAGTSFDGEGFYNYTRQGDVIKLGQVVNPNGTWTNGWVVANVRNFFENAELKIDWVPSTDPNVSNIGGLYKVNDPTNIFYGVVTKE